MTAPRPVPVNDAAGATCNDEWLTRFKSVWPLRLKEPVTDDAVLQKLHAEYPQDPELAAWDRYLNALREADEWTDAMVHRPMSTHR